MSGQEDAMSLFNVCECTRKNAFGITSIFAKDNYVVEFRDTITKRSLFDIDNRVGRITRIGPQGIFVLSDGDENEHVSSPNRLVVIDKDIYERLTMTFTGASR
jgi:hypothetical protein